MPLSRSPLKNLLQEKSSFLIPFLVAGALFMENLDGTVLVTAIPSIATSFRCNAVDVNVGLTAYLVALAVFIPSSGWTADRFGLKRTFMTAITIFTASSVLCGLSQNLPSFILARVIQGFGGAMMVPVGRLAVLRATPKADLLRAISTITWPALIAPVLGPAVGGYITNTLGWKWIFFINVPLGLMAIVLTLLIFPRGEAGVRRPFDVTGFLLTTLSCAALGYGFEAVGHKGELPRALAILLVAASTGFLAIRHSLKSKTGWLDLHSLKIPTFRVALAGGSLFRVSIFSIPFLVPLMLQLAFHENPFQAGLLTLMVFLGNLGMKMFTTPIIRKFRFRPVLVVNGIIMALMIAACGLISPQMSFVLQSIILFVGGLSRSLQFTALNTIAFVDIPTEKMSGANTLSNMLHQLSVASSIALCSILLRVVSRWRSHNAETPSLTDFKLTFCIVAVIALVATYDCVKLAPDAGLHVSAPTKT